MVCYMSNNLGSRIKAEREKKGWSQIELAKRANITQGAVSQLERAISTNSRYIGNIAKALSIPVDYLLNDISKIHMQMPSMSEFVIIGGEDSGKNPNPDDYIMIPRYDMCASCGKGIAFTEVKIISGLVFKRDWLERHGLPEAQYLMTVETLGMSMYPTISEGAILLANTLDILPKSGKVYLIVINNELVAKRLIQDIDGWIIRSDNADKNTYPDIRITFERFHEIKIKARVVWQGSTM